MPVTPPVTCRAWANALSLFRESFAMTGIVGKSFPAVKKNLRGTYGNSFPKVGNRLPGMNARKKSALDILVDNLTELMAMPGHEHIATGPKLAEVAKVDRKSVNNLLKKRYSPNIETIEKLAKAFKMDVYFLLMPVEQKGFTMVCRAYSDTDERGREILLDLADSIIKKSERTKNSEAFRA
jgi:transcriptional regulator with XRE-family HTH domain